MTYKATDLLRSPALLEKHTGLFLFVYEWSADTSGKATAELINHLAAQGWLLQHFSAAPGGGFSGKQLVLYSIFRKAKRS